MNTRNRSAMEQLASLRNTAQEIDTVDTMDTVNLPGLQWPPKHNLFGVQVSAVTHDEACQSILAAARERIPAVVSAFAVHALIEASATRDFSAKVNRFAIVSPDGQPIRWALKWLHGARLPRTVQGYELMWQLCRDASRDGISIYLYGSSPGTLAKLEANLRRAFPDLKIAGVESPPFRALTPEEDAEMVERVNASGAGLMFLGLGCPKQDLFAADHADRIQAVQLCVGAAFDFLAGTKPAAPMWMQRRGLAWVFRLYQEPNRLWKRYLVTNSIFLRKLTAQFLRQRVLRL
jgi:N-acetylglucosaminyldiphosphoundecaprenol N-acetyl-beta-D-mannosaminyltransferase